MAHPTPLALTSPGLDDSTVLTGPDGIGSLNPAATDGRKSRTSSLKTAQDLFIRRWGEMGQTWGINRTMAEIHALLYITGQPQCTDDVMERLNISRGNASMSLRALCDWGIIRRLHKRGERREYFESLTRRLGDVLHHRRRAQAPGDGPGAGDDQAVPADAGRERASARPPRSTKPSCSPASGWRAWKSSWK